MTATTGSSTRTCCFLNFFADHDTDTRTPLRFSIVGDKAADFDLKSKPAQDFFAYLRQHKTVIDPTVATFESTFVGAAGQGPGRRGVDRPAAARPGAARAS